MRILLSSIVAVGLLLSAMRTAPAAGTVIDSMDQVSFATQDPTGHIALVPGKIGGAEKLHPVAISGMG